MPVRHTWLDRVSCTSYSEDRTLCTTPSSVTLQVCTLVITGLRTISFRRRLDPMVQRLRRRDRGAESVGRAIGRVSPTKPTMESGEGRELPHLGLGCKTNLVHSSGPGGRWSTTAFVFCILLSFEMYVVF